MRLWAWTCLDDKRILPPYVFHSRVIERFASWHLSDQILMDPDVEPNELRTIETAG